MRYVIAALSGLILGAVLGFIIGANAGYDIAKGASSIDAKMLAGLKRAQRQGWLDGKNSTRETP